MFSDWQLTFVKLLFDDVVPHFTRLVAGVWKAVCCDKFCYLAATLPARKNSPLQSKVAELAKPNDVINCGDMQYDTDAKTKPGYGTVAINSPTKGTTAKTRLSCLSNITNRRNMANGFKYLLLLLWISFLFIIGTIFFTRGFLLKRAALQDRSTCGNNFADHFVTLDSNRTVQKLLNLRSTSTCWLPQKYAKAVIIILDGLRYDFADYNEFLGVSDVLFFQNKLPIIHELVNEQPQNAALLKFIADPPTTTMQRIKGLITGSLPTFIDAGYNFASIEISEDNIIDQLVKQGKKITFMGDDTWMGLVPKRFYRSFPFPSFNVKDLDTVDDGILEHLFPELQKNWDVLIAHFLGIDHCGHRYGPNHVAMAEKLTQMDKMLRSTVDSLDHETLLVVMGDHGMTRTGDHGGDSAEEVGSALFMYSKKLLRRVTVDSPHEVSQIDFPPTFSLLLGIPIPFGNLGTVIDDFFTLVRDNLTQTQYSDTGSNKSDFQSEFHAAMALYSNVKQVEAYLKRYHAVSSDLSENADQFVNWQQAVVEIDVLWRIVSQSSDPNRQLAAIKNRCKTYLKSVKETCQKIWAQFDIPSIIVGLCITICALLVVASYGVFQVQTSPRVAAILFLLALCGSVFIVHAVYPLFNVLRGCETVVALTIAFTSLSFFVINTLHNHSWSCRGSSLQLEKTTAVPFVAAFFTCCCFFSNSYVVSEDSLSSFLVMTVLWWEVMTHKTSLKNLEIKPKSKSEQNFHKGRLISVALAALGSWLLRMQKAFWKCREEQWWCQSSEFSRSLANIPTHSEEYISYKNWRFFTSVVSIWTIIFSLQWLMRKAGNMNGFLPAVLCMSYSPILIGLCISCYWALQGLSTTIIFNAFNSYQVVLPNAVFSTAIASVLIFFFRPLCVYVVQQEQEEIGPILSVDKSERLHQVYRHLKANWRKHLISSSSSGAEKQPLIIYGLASAFSATLIGVITIMVQVHMLMGGDGIAGSFLLMVMSVSSVLHCLASMKTGDFKDSCVLRVSWTWVILWSMITSMEFYATGHQQTFPSIQWDSAVLGTDGNFESQLLPAAKVLLNTYSSQILIGLCIPLLFLWPITGRSVFGLHDYIPSNVIDKLKQGEFFLFDNDKLFSGLFDVICKCLAVLSSRLICSMISAAILRRHLMVWKIFAPRFLFEAIAFLTSIPVILLVYILMISIDATISSWLKRLDIQVSSS